MMTKAGELAADQIRRRGRDREATCCPDGEGRTTGSERFIPAQAKGEKAFDSIGDAIHRRHLREGRQPWYFSQLMDTIKAARPRLLGMLENAEAVRDLAFEMFGRDTGNAAAKAGQRPGRGDRSHAPALQRPGGK